MKSLLLLICVFLMSFAGAAPAQIAGAAAQPAQPSAHPQAGFTNAEQKAFAALHPIDVHTHVYKNDPSFTALLQKLNLHIVDILVADPTDTASHRTFDQLRREAWQAVAADNGRVSLSTTFDPFDWDTPAFPKAAIQAIDADFARGAVGATIWSNPGMAIKDAGEKPALPDNSKLEPVYQDIAGRHKPLFAHLTADDEDWEAGAAPGRADAAGDLPVPPILRARDHIVRNNPQLRVIAAHLGSVKEGLAQIGHRLDQYPNLAIDTAGRVDSLMAMPRGQVRDFLLKYQDRVLYGTDNSFRQNDAAGAVPARWESRYAVDWRYFSSRDTFQYHGRSVQGLDLPPAVLRKLYRGNAVHWIPGVGR